MKVGFATGLLVLACVLEGGSAAADCFEPEASLTWSSPSDGATDVPTNAVLYFGSTTYVEDVRLNDQPLPTRSVVEGEVLRVFVPTGLVPDTTYTLNISLRSPGGDEPPTVLTRTFRTGTGPLEGGAPTLAVRDLSVRDEPLSEACQAVMEANGCYDEGQDTLVQLDLEADATAYLVQSGHEGSDGFFSRVLWPGTCGAPAVYFFADSPACHTVYALDAAGHASAGKTVCGAANETDAFDGSDDGDAGVVGDGEQDDGGSVHVPESKAPSSGCSVDSAGASAPAWACLVLLTVLRRRRRRWERSGAA